MQECVISAKIAIFVCLEMRIHWLILCALPFTFQDNALADLRQDIDSNESRKDKLFKNCNKNLYRTNFQNGMLVANNTVYRSTKTCENGGIEGFEQVAPLDQMFKVDSSYIGGSCSEYSQWSIKKPYPHSPLRYLQHLRKHINCGFTNKYGKVDETFVESEYFSIKWFCFDGLLGTRECQERIDQ